MDPAEETPFRAAVEIQGAMLGRHEDEISNARHAVESLAAQVTDLSTRFHHFRLETPTSQRVHSSSEPRINNPPCYAAREWGTAVWEMQKDCCDQYALFKEEMIKVFDRSVYGQEASRLLSVLRQGRRSVADFAIEFRTLATTCGWK
ncbi:hypothetical protein PO909_029519 [Leuciscus waleckii]